MAVQFLNRPTFLIEITRCNIAFRFKRGLSHQGEIERLVALAFQPFHTDRRSAAGMFANPDAVEGDAPRPGLALLLMLRHEEWHRDKGQADVVGLRRSR